MTTLFLFKLDPFYTHSFRLMIKMEEEEEVQNKQQQLEQQEGTQEKQSTSRIVTDGVSDLQNLTRILVSRMGDMIEHVLLKSSEVKEEGSKDGFQVEEEVCLLPFHFNLCRLINV